MVDPEPISAEAGRWEVAWPEERPIPPRRSLPPAATVIGWYLDEKKGAWTESTYARQRSGLKVFERWLNCRPLTREMVVAYRDYLAKERNGGFYQLEWTIASSFINWLVRNRWVDPSIIDSISPPPPKKPLYRPPIRDAHYEKLMAHPEVNPMVKWVATIMWATGMALVDAMELRWEDVDLERMVITKARRKTKAFTRPCIIPIDPAGELASGLIERNERSLAHEAARRVFRPDYKRDEWVEPDAYRMKLDNRWKRAWNKARELCGIDKSYSPHCFRRGFVTKLVEGGVNPIIGCAITGHSNPSTFLRYATMDPENVRAEMDRAMAEANLKRLNGAGRNQLLKG